MFAFCRGKGPGKEGDDQSGPGAAAVVEGADLAADLILLSGDRGTGAEQVLGYDYVEQVAGSAEAAHRQGEDVVVHAVVDVGGLGLPIRQAPEDGPVDACLGLRHSCHAPRRCCQKKI